MEQTTSQEPVAAEPAGFCVLYRELGADSWRWGGPLFGKQEYAAETALNLQAIGWDVQVCALIPVS